MVPITIHATPQQTNMILRGGNKKRHMKNNNKNIVQGVPGITLYPIKQFRKGEEWKEEGFINSMKNNNSYDKIKKNKIYNERTQFQVLHNNFNKFIKNGMNPSDFNDKIDRYYTSLSNDELIDVRGELKNDYTKFYNDKLEESRVKYKTIRANYQKKQDERRIRNELRERREQNISCLEEKIYTDLEMKENMTYAKCQRRITMIYDILQKGGYSSTNNYINSSREKELVF